MILFFKDGTYNQKDSLKTDETTKVTYIDTETATKYIDEDLININTEVVDKEKYLINGVTVNEHRSLKLSKETDETTPLTYVDTESMTKDIGENLNDINYELINGVTLGEPNSLRPHKETDETTLATYIDTKSATIDIDEDLYDINNKELMDKEENTINEVTLEEHLSSKPGIERWGLMYYSVHRLHKLWGR